MKKLTKYLNAIMYGAIISATTYLIFSIANWSFLLPDWEENYPKFFAALSVIFIVINILIHGLANIVEDAREEARLRSEERNPVKPKKPKTDETP